MPRLSDSMEEGTILKWLKPEGAEVKRGEEIVEIETDKATMSYEADADGALHIVAAEGDTLPIGALIATIGEAAPAATEPTAPRSRLPRRRPPTPATATPRSAPPRAGAHSRQPRSRRPHPAPGPRRPHSHAASRPSAESI